MATSEKLRDSIISKIKNLSDEKLLNLNAYLNGLESDFPTGKSALSFSGIFKDLDLNELTSELHKNRKDHSKRIPQF